MNMITVGSLLLLVGGVVHTIPPIGTGLAQVFGGTPVIQVTIGAISVIVGLVMFVKKVVLS